MFYSLISYLNTRSCIEESHVLRQLDPKGFPIIDIGVGTWCQSGNDVKQNKLSAIRCGSYSSSDTYFEVNHDLQLDTLYVGIFGWAILYQNSSLRQSYSFPTLVVRTQHVEESYLTLPKLYPRAAMSNPFTIPFVRPLV